MDIIKRKPNKQLITLKKLSDEEVQKVITEITERKNNWDSALTVRRHVISMVRAAWYAGLGGYDFESPILNEDEELELGLVYSMIESIVAQIVNVIFPSGNDFFHTRPQAENDILFTDRAKKLIMWLLDRMEFRKNYIPVVRAVARDGISCVKIIWNSDKQWTRKLIKDPVYSSEVNPETGIPELLGYQEYYIDEVGTYKDQPEIINVDVMKLSFNPLCKNFDDADVLERKFVSLQYLKDQNDDANEVYSNLDDLETLIGKRIKEQIDTPVSRIVTTDDPLQVGMPVSTNNAGVSDYGIRTMDNIEIWEYYGDIPLELDNGKTIVLRNYKATIADEGKVLIQLEPSPYGLNGLIKKHPYLLGECVSDPDYPARSRGIADSIIPMQKHANTMIKSVVGLTERRARGMWQAVEDEVSKDTIDVLESSKSGVLMVPYHDAIRPLQEPGNYQPQLEVLKFIKSEAQEYTGATSMFMGQIDRARRTATEQSIRAEAMNAKLKMILINQEAILSQILLRIFELSKVCLEDSVWIRLNEDNPPSMEEIRSYELEKNSFDFQIYTISDALNRSELVERMMQFAEIAAKFGLNVNMQKLGTYIGMALKLPTTDLITPEKMIPESEANQQLQMMAQMISGGDPQVMQQIMVQFQQVMQQQQKQGGQNA